LEAEHDGVAGCCRGQTQAEQADVMKRFRRYARCLSGVTEMVGVGGGGGAVFVILLCSGVCNVLVATCIGEEGEAAASDCDAPHAASGLDVGEVDLIVQYDAGGCGS
jgi:hypothetical protein